jgi:diguanylate cyclase (GGDEF)-like protein
VIGAQLARAARDASSLSLLMIDVDRFKQVNDLFGHCEGDEVLRAVARALRGVVRCSDFPCRFGGEEFVLLLPDTLPEDALALAERIRAAVTRECRDRTAAAARSPITVSIGLAYASEAPTPAGLLELADRRLYEAKRSGRDRTAATGSLPRPRRLHVA